MFVIRTSSSFFLGAALAVGLLAGCGGDDDGTAQEEPAATTPDTAGPTATATDPEDVDATTTTTTTTTTTSTTTTTTTVPPPVIAGAAPVEQLTDPSGGGERPLLSWEPIDEAATYLVVVYDADGVAYWSAITDQTEVYVGGPLPIPAERTGPRVAPGFTWVVSADGVDGTLLAVSGRRPIEP